MSGGLKLAAWGFRDGADCGVFLLWDADAITVQFEPMDALSEEAVEDRKRSFAIREYCARWKIPVGDLKA